MIVEKRDFAVEERGYSGCSWFLQKRDLLIFETAKRAVWSSSNSFILDSCKFLFCRFTSLGNSTFNWTVTFICWNAMLIINTILAIEDILKIIKGPTEPDPGKDDKANSMLLLKMSHGQKYSLWPKAFLWMPEVNLFTFIFCLGFKSALQNWTKSTPRGPSSCSRCKCEQERGWVCSLQCAVFKSCWWYSGVDQAPYIFFREESIIPLLCYLNISQDHPFLYREKGCLIIMSLQITGKGRIWHMFPVVGGGQSGKARHNILNRLSKRSCLWYQGTFPNVI